ncbi:MAG: hypothetical protein SFU86_19980 [Pirellulaceae bacterium]|nr:hypothetical protein [Pirellulaceae bacterium]
MLAAFAGERPVIVEVLMRPFVASLVLIVLAGCGGGNTGPVEPAQLTPDEEKAIMQRMQQNAAQEAPPPAESP